MSEVGCDFCSVDATPAWVYPCEDFTMGYMFGIGKSSGEVRGPTEHVSTGAWLACELCSTLIEADDWPGLTERAIIAAHTHPDLRDGMAELLASMWEGFRAHRTGPRVVFG